MWLGGTCPGARHWLFDAPARPVHRQHALEARERLRVAAEPRAQRALVRRLARRDRRPRLREHRLYCSLCHESHSAA